MSGMSQFDPLTDMTAIQGALTLAPKIESILGIGGSGNQSDPAGAVRQQAFQAAEAAQAQTQAAAQAAALAARAKPAGWSTTTKLLVFGGAGLLLLGFMGILVYRRMDSGEQQ
jgi:hypothetical protein